MCDVLIRVDYGMLLRTKSLSAGSSTMSDTYQRYRAIKQAILQFYQPHPHGHREKHFNTLVALICGLAGSKLRPSPSHC